MVRWSAEARTTSIRGLRWVREMHDRGWLRWVREIIHGRGSMSIIIRDARVGPSPSPTPGDGDSRRQMARNTTYCAP